MKSLSAMRFRTVLPLSAFVLHPLTAVVVAAVHVYLAAGHFAQLLSAAIFSGRTSGRASARWAAHTCLRHWRRGGLPDK
jgi:hypothetical protein